MPITWLHLSDWHERGHGFDRKRTRDALLVDISRRSDIDERLGRLDFIVFSGDAAFSGRPEEFDTVKRELFEPILTEVGLTHDRLITVPGNHDLYRPGWDYVAREPLLKLGDSDSVAALLSNDLARQATLGPLRNYAAFASHYAAGSDADASRAFGYSRTMTVSGASVAVIALNSTWLSGLNRNSRDEVDDRGHLLVGEPQAYELVRACDNADVRIAVAHHPLAWMADFDRFPVERLLVASCDFILHGHEHVPDVRAATALAGSAVVVPAGASYERAEENYARSYNYVCVESRSESATVFLRRWDRANRCWQPDSGAARDGKVDVPLGRAPSESRGRPLTAPSSTRREIWSVPTVGRLFSGRTAFLRELRTSLEAHGVAIVTGLGGVGKTRVAAEYARQYASEYDIVYWARADSQTTLLEDLSLLAGHLDLPEKDDQDQAVAAAATVRALRRHNRWLLVFDNASQARELLPVLPDVSGGGHVVITSVDRTGWSALGEELSLTVWSAEESRAFCEARVGAGNPAVYLSLAAALGYLPLALEQAAAYMLANGLGPDEYLSRLREHAPELFKEGRPVDYKHTVATTWELALAELKRNQPALEVLKCSAYFAPTGIPRTLFEAPPPVDRAFEGLDGSSVALDRAVMALSRYSLVEPRHETLTFHRLVQQVVRDRAAREAGTNWTAVAVRVLAARFPRDALPRDWTQAARLAPHSMAALDAAIAAGLSNRHVGTLSSRVARYLTSRGMPVSAAARWEQAVASLRHAGPSVELGISLVSCGHCQVLAGNRKPGLETAREGYAMLRARLPQNHPELPAAMGTIGAARRIAGDVDGALGTLERALARLRRSGNPDVTDLAVLQGNYGLALRDARRLDDAWRTMEDVEALFRELRGDDDPDVARSVSNLGEIAMLMGNLDVAETKLAEGVEIFERTAGPDHPDTAEARSVLAQVRALAGRAGPDAVSRVESDLETVQSVVGVSELRLAVILFRLGAIKAALGDTDAKDVLRRARSMMVDRGMPETHADIADLDELIART